MLLLFILKQATGITAICFSLAIAFGQLINSINIKMFVDLLHTGNNINFGFSRSFGSLSYGLAALIVSFMIPAFGIRVIPLICFIATAAELIPIFFLKQSFSIAASKSVFSEDRQVSGGTRNTVQFLRRNRQYFTLLIGLALLFAANNSVANYMIIIIENIGGSITDLGKITCFFALLECPTMLLYSKLRGRFSSTTLLRLSLSFFFAKAVIICISQSIPMLYLAFTTQIFSTGLYAPVIVDYINENISYEDSAKAQSLAMVTATIGTIIASTI
ncbi:MAG: MFS transporter, partial [Oscillospiraceae bacterium]|nr:MFS transporter [Oscillospiraceae bacterium]